MKYLRTLKLPSHLPISSSTSRVLRAGGIARRRTPQFRADPGSSGTAKCSCNRRKSPARHGKPRTCRRLCNHGKNKRLRPERIVSEALLKGRSRLERTSRCFKKTGKLLIWQSQVGPAWRAFADIAFAFSDVVETETWFETSRPRFETSKFVHFAKLFFKMSPSLLSWIFFKFLAFLRPLLVVSYLQIQQTKIVELYKFY